MLAHGPTSTELVRRAAELTLDGRFDESRGLWLALVADPAGQQWTERAIVEALEWPTLDVATELATLLAAARWGSVWYPPPTAACRPPTPAEPPRTTLSAAKLRFDAAQLAHLRETELVVDAGLDAITADYCDLADRLDAIGPEARLALEGADRQRIGHVYNRIVHIAAGERVGRALSRSWRGDAVEDEYLGAPPGVVVIDDFLAADALHALQRFCRDSTVWTGTRYSHGRLGAFFVDGFAPPVLAQIASELPAALPRLLGRRHLLRQMWAYTYAPRVARPSTLHADFAAVNVNIWIAPETANRDPTGGGLLVYDVTAPSEWDFETYNRRPDLIERFLGERGARVRVIPHRENRAVIFNSDLFHATAPIDFRPGLANRRVNVTLLYGERAGPDPVGAADARPGAWRSASWTTTR